MKKTKKRSGRNPLPLNLKRVAVRFYTTIGEVEKNGGNKSLIEKIKKNYNLS